MSRASWSACFASAIQAIPATLQQSLMARLDRLGPAREVAQIGSVIGRGFSYGLLRDVAGMEDVVLQAALERLAEVSASRRLQATGRAKILTITRREVNSREQSSGSTVGSVQSFSHI
jgi:hypothetical protein